MRTNINAEKIEGRLYEHNLAIKTVQNKDSENFGKEFIQGTLDIATDEQGLNIVQVNFMYVTPVFNSGKKNNTYDELEKIIKEGKCWVTNGSEEAWKIKIDNSTLGLNDFYTSSKEESHVSVKRNEGGFVRVVNQLCDESSRATFKVDMIITSTRLIEADEEKDIKSDYLILHGAVFNFRNNLLPVELVVRNPEGIEYFESQDISNAEPLYTKVWGNIVSRTVEKKETTESAFGLPEVNIVRKSEKEWLVTGVSTSPYEFGEEGVLTKEELTKLQADRNVALAEIKKRRDDYEASKKTSAPSKEVSEGAKTAMNAPAGTFNF